MEKKNRSFYLVFISVFLLLGNLLAEAQTGRTISGIVVSEVGNEPLIGVNVVQKGTTNGAVTDLDGRFTLTVPDGSVLQITYIGYQEQLLTVKPNIAIYQVTLKEDSQALDEVVVVGYGIQKKKLVTGATVQVKGDDIQKLNTVSALGALQSQTPGGEHYPIIRYAGRRFQCDNTWFGYNRFFGTFIHYRRGYRCGYQ